MSAGVLRIDANVRAHDERVPLNDAPSRSIASWLLDGGVQLDVDPQRGGVAGSIGTDGRAEYVYPEITGYYLQWLAWIATCEGLNSSLAHRAAMAQQWLVRWIRRTDPPATRVYLGAHDRDWRNQALFFFDLAMVLRGVASATRARLIEVDADLVRHAAACLSQLIGDDGMFNPCRVIPGSAPVPDRWSTRRGGFLAKAAAGVLAAGTVLPGIGARNRDVAAATLAASLDAAVGTPHDETHPTLYAIEGALAAPDRKMVAPLLPALTNQIDMLLAHAAVDGWLPESNINVGPGRLDVVAQALRATVLLRTRCVDWSPDSRALEKMRQLLVGYIAPTGAVPFAPRAGNLQYSSWCAMFAEQALQACKPAVSQARLFDLEAYLV